MVGDMGISAFFSFSLSVFVMRPMRDIEYQHSQKMCIRDGCRTSLDLAAIPCPAGFNPRVQRPSSPSSPLLSDLMIPDITPIRDCMVPFSLPGCRSEETAISFTMSSCGFPDISGEPFLFQGVPMPSGYVGVACQCKRAAKEYSCQIGKISRPRSLRSL